MGVVLPFPEIKRVRPTGRERLSLAAPGDYAMIAEAILAAADQPAALAAAHPLLDSCAERYGFIVMLDGLPRERAVLARVVIELDRALWILDAEMSVPRTYPTFGVYFGRRQLAWFEDGYSGATGLAVPNDIDATALAGFVRPRVAGRSRSSQ